MTTATTATGGIDWAPARLIPVVGMEGEREKEQRSTSALLAVMEVVPSFGRAILRYLGAPGGRVKCYVECHFKDDDDVTVIPDGAIVVEWGNKRWVCLVEVKTGSSVLNSAQVERYLKIAARDSLAAVLTISNQLAPSPTESPVSVDKRLLKKVRLGHLSWFRVLTEAVTEKEHRGVTDPEQAKVLDDLIAFLDDERSGAGGYEGMGKDWVSVRDAAKQGLLTTTTSGLTEVAEGWDRFLAYLSLRLRQDLGRPVTVVHPKDTEAKARTQATLRRLVAEGRMAGEVKVPDAVAPVSIEVNLRARQTTTTLRVASPKEGKPKTRINWLLRQLTNAPPDVRVGVHYPYSQHSPIALIADAKARPEVLLLRDDPKRAPSFFEVALTRDMGLKRGKSEGSFVADTTKQVLEFYGTVVQAIRKWTPRPPQLPGDALGREEDQNAQTRMPVLSEPEGQAPPVATETPPTSTLAPPRE